MYAYSHDPETGGLLLADSLSEFSKEPRPVWAAELDLLGFGELWKYDNGCVAPYLWAESNFYWYRGQKVAKTNGGSLYEKPEIELLKDENGKEILPEGTTLTPVNIEAMLAKNRLRIEALETLTVKKIYDIYRKYEKKLDCFHVAFSGGKDSIALLELVRRALPRTAFMVVFGDTGMEFPDTYKAVDAEEARCKEDGIAFYRAKSRFAPEESWRLFGPPSRILRWCCTVHKSVPQTLRIREILGKRDYTGMAFVGVRGHESDARANYDEVITSRKTVGQKSCNPMLEWSSAEVWLYIFLRGLIINHAYRLGNQRAGCIYCPMSIKTDYVKKASYPDIFKKFENVALEHYSPENLKNGYWRARVNGVQLVGNKAKIIQSSVDEQEIYEVINPTTSIRTWLKTLGKVPFEFIVDETTTGFTLRFPSEARKVSPVCVGKLRALINKAAYCVGCGACAADCRHGCLSFSQGLSIDNCIHCQECNGIDGGCLVYQSRKFPTVKGESRMKASINCFHTHAPKPEWIADFFAKKDEFLSNNSLGPDQISNFRTFLRAAGLLEGGKFSNLAEMLVKIGWNSEMANSIMLVNLAYNAQMNWYIQNLAVDHKYSRQEVLALLSEQGCSAINARMVVSAYKRICDLALGTKLHFGKTEEKGKNLLSLTRTKPVVPSPLVMLYALYRFAEGCGGYYEFSLSRLLDFTVEAEGVSPAQIFALARDEMEALLNGLARTNPDFVTFTTTHDLELVRLADDKTPADVIALFNV